MFEKIVVPLDGSELSERTLFYVERLLSKIAPEVKVEVILILVITRASHYVIAGDSFTPVEYTEAEMDLAIKNSTEYLNGVGERLREKGATVLVRVALGDACEEIINLAHENKADLIIMSSHGRSGISRWAFGSVADKVLRHEGTTPVLIVKAAQPNE